MVFTTRVSLYKRHAVAIVVALFVLALLVLTGNASLAPVGAAPTNQMPAQPTPTTTARPILLTDPVTDPKQVGVQYYPQTGHTLRGAFLDYWNKYGGLAQFGYPLTEEFFEEVGSEHEQYQVQYFERNRFELHPENKGTHYEVLLGVLGRDFRQQDPPAAPIAGSTFFGETGHNLSAVFKQYWETHGGLFVHGFPITEPQMERSTNGKDYLVQWFERSRFELHPENAGSQYEVLLGVLGRQLSEKKGLPYGWYPFWGHAPDYSWVSGFIVSLWSPDWLSWLGPCSILSYSKEPVGRLNMIEMNGASYYDLLIKELGWPTEEELVVFGQLAPDKYKHEGLCVDQTRAPLYIVTHGQTNPTR